MRTLFVIAFVTLYGCINQKEKLVGQQAVVKTKMDSVEVLKSSTVMLIQEWTSDKKWDSISKTDYGKTYYNNLQQVFEGYNSAYKQLSRQYDSLDAEINKH